VIISRTPYRISFFGGGTDYPVWYREHGGIVLNATIDKYSYITCRDLPPFFDYKYRLRYYYREEANNLDELKHPSARECLRLLEMTDGVDIVHHGDLPAQSGLGSSSTFTVGLLHALHTLKRYMPTQRELALNAIHVEQNMIQEAVGSQDQVAAAFGGLNQIVFGGTQEATVRPVILEENRLKILQDNLMLFFTGLSRNATEVAKEQITQTPNKKATLNQMCQLTMEAISTLVSQSNRLDDFGRLLDEQWKLKKDMSSLISNSTLDDIYETGIKAGALGGKLLGAGNGGFMLFYAPPECQENIKRALKKLLYVPFRFEYLGSQIIYYSHDQ